MSDHETSSSDQFLVQRVLAGSESAFSELFHRYYDRVRDFAYRIVLDYQASDDVAQETFIRAASRLSTLRENQAFAAWVFRVASNVAKDHLRAQSSHRRKITQASEQPHAMEPEARAEDPQAVRALQAMHALPPKQREAVALVWFENCSHAEAAARVGCAESTISWRMALAKRTLRKKLSP